MIYLVIWYLCGWLGLLIACRFKIDWTAVKNKENLFLFMIVPFFGPTLLAFMMVEEYVEWKSNNNKNKNK